MKLDEAPKAYDIFDKKEDATKIVFKPLDTFASKIINKMSWLHHNNIQHYSPGWRKGCCGPDNCSGGGEGGAEDPNTWLKVGKISNPDMMSTITSEVNLAINSILILLLGIIIILNCVSVVNKIK